MDNTAWEKRKDASKVDCLVSIVGNRILSDAEVFIDHRTGAISRPSGTMTPPLKQISPAGVIMRTVSGLAARIVPVVLMCVSQHALAEIVSASPTGFSIRHVIEAPGVPLATAWAALSDVGKWWDPEHTYSGDSRNLSIDPVPGGCFCERLGMYAGVEHLEVVFAQPPKTLRLVGALGPLQEFGVSGSLTWSLEAAGGGSRLTMTYNVGGAADRPLADWAPIVDEVLGTQVKRLGKFLVTGNPTGESKAETKP
ncbi:MAG: SRPBCC domain-containing protein [Povalibacter sp.]